MKKKHFLFLFIFLFIKPIIAQYKLSVYAEVSIVTAGPGNEIYSTFGHSAIRIKDPVLNLDLIYNYGVFDFNTPNFYSKFAKGNLTYTLARYEFKYFKESYKREKRWLKQQVLNLSQKEKQKYFTFLENNALAQNADYSYDPYFNNCATILRDITSSVLGDKVFFKTNSTENNLTLRQLMDKEMYWNTWGSFGINLIAGTILEKKVTSLEYMYLPDYVYNGFKEATLFVKKQPQPLIKREDIILDFEEHEQKSGLFNPLLAFSLLAILVLLITYKDVKKGKRSKWLDFSLFLLTGIIGCVIMFLWFFSTHSTAPNNYNLLWAFAPNLIIAFLLLKRNQQKWIKKYMQVLIVLLIIVSILWIAGIQQLPLAIIPLLILLFTRYLFLSKRISY